MQHDVQNAFIGLPGEDGLLKAASLMSRTIDPRMPTELNKAEVAEIEQASQELQDLKQAASEARSSCLDVYETLKSAGGTEVHKSFLTAQRRAQNFARRLQAEALANKREEFIRFAAVDDVQRQIHGLPSTVPAPDAPVRHFHPERTRVAEALFTRQVFVPGSDEDVERRIDVLTELVKLSRLREPPRRPNRSALGSENEAGSSSSEDTLCNSPGADSDFQLPSLPDIMDRDSELDGPDHSAQVPSIDVDTTEDSCDALFGDMVDIDMLSMPTELDSQTCLFCYFDPSFGEGHVSASRFCSDFSMRRHARNMHFKRHVKDQPFACPDAACAGQEFIHVNHFKNHAYRVHKVEFC